MKGFLCNLLNPKATLSFFALFTMIIKPETSSAWMEIYAIEMVFITIGWFCILTIILSHQCIADLLSESEKYISKLLEWKIA